MTKPTPEIKAKTDAKVTKTTETVGKMSAPATTAKKPAQASPVKS